jgi:hypothetical protein
MSDEPQALELTPWAIDQGTLIWNAIIRIALLEGQPGSLATAQRTIVRMIAGLLPQWRPIETGDRSGTVLLGWTSGAYRSVTGYYLPGSNWVDADGNHLDPQPDVWMRRPDTPEGSKHHP